MRTPPQSLQGSQTGELTATRPPSAASALDRTDDVAVAETALKFGSLVNEGQQRKRTDLDVLAATFVHALTLGTSSATTLGLARSIGSSVADIGMRAVFERSQITGVGSDSTSFGISEQQSTFLVANILARYAGGAIGGAVGSAVSNVATPHIAHLVGKQLRPVAPNDIVPDSVAHLFQPDGQCYGAQGVARLREEVAARQKKLKDMGGENHVRGGQAASGATNAARGAIQAKRPMGIVPDAGVSTLVSAVSGGSNGIYTAFAMVDDRFQVPDVRHTGDGPAPMVDLPTFQVGTPDPVPARFTGPNYQATMANIAAGISDRVLQLLKASQPSAIASLAGTVIAAATSEPGAPSRRAVQAAESAVGAALTLGNWYRSQDAIKTGDEGRIARQTVERTGSRQRGPGDEDIEMQRRGA